MISSNSPSEDETPALKEATVPTEPSPPNPGSGSERGSARSVSAPEPGIARSGSDAARPHPDISVEQTGPVLTVTLDNPQRRNCQTPSLWDALAGIANSVPREVRVIVLRGAGPSFSAGLDRRLLTPEGIPGEVNFLAMAAGGGAAPDEAREAVISAIAQAQQAFSSWTSCSAIVIAAVQGHAIGAGFQLALAADLRVVADDVSMVIAEPQLGIVPDLGGTHPLVRTLGYSRALEICLTGRPVGAPEAVASGLASLAVPAAELSAATADLVAAVLQAPEPAVRELKPLLLGAVDNDYEAQLLAERQAQSRVLSMLVGRT